MTVKSGLVGLGVWFSLRVREVPGSNPGRALQVSLKEMHVATSYIDYLSQISNTAMSYAAKKGDTWLSVFIWKSCWVVFWLHATSLTSSTNLLVHENSFARVKIRLKSRLVGLGVWFSLWVREVPGSNPGRAHFVYFLIKLKAKTLK